MSWRALRHVMEHVDARKMGAVAHHVLATLAWLYDDETAAACPSMAALAERVGLDVSNARRRVRALESAGEVASVEGVGRSSRYDLIGYRSCPDCADPGRAPAPDPPTPRSGASARPPDPEVGRQRPTPSGGSARPPDPEVGRERPTPPVASARPGRAGAPDDLEVQEVQDLELDLEDLKPLTPAQPTSPSGPLRPRPSSPSLPLRLPSPDAEEPPRSQGKGRQPRDPLAHDAAVRVRQAFREAEGVDTRSVVKVQSVIAALVRRGHQLDAIEAHTLAVLRDPEQAAFFTADKVDAAIRRGRPGASPRARPSWADEREAAEQARAAERRALDAHLENTRLSTWRPEEAP